MVSQSAAAKATAKGYPAAAVLNSDRPGGVALRLGAPMGVPFRSTIRRPPCTSLRWAAWGLENELDVFTVQLPSLWRNGNVPMVTWEVWPSKGTRPDVVALSSGAD